MIQIYHNPRCKKSRAGLQYLTERGVKPEIINYIAEGISETDLEKLLQKLNKKPEEIIRRQEEYFKKELKNKEFTDKEWLKILIENPKLIQRPIVVKDYKAVIGDPVENIDNLKI